MNRILLFLCLFAFLSQDMVAAARPLRTHVAERLYHILKDEDLSAEMRLEKLRKLSENKAYALEDRIYVIAERAALLIQADQVDQARQELEAALSGQAEEFYPPARLVLARTLLMTEQIEKALVQFEIWRRVEPNPDLSSLFLLSYGYLRLERYGECIEVLEQLVQDNPQANVSWIELLAHAYAQTGKEQKAVDLLLGLVERFPEHSRIWRSLSSFYQMNEDVPNGAAALDTAGHLEEMSLMDASYLARMYAYLGMPDNGAAVLQAAIDRSVDEHSHKTFMLLARLHLQARNFDQAESSLMRAGEITEDGEPYLYLGQLYLHWERYQEALGSLKNAVRLYGEEVPANTFYLLAIAAINLDQPQLARDALVRIEDVDSYKKQVANLKGFLPR